MIISFLSAVAGAVVACLFSCLPGFHIYSVLAAFVVAVQCIWPDAPAEVIVPFAGALMVGYVFASTIPSNILAAPDESAIFSVLPGQKYLMSGRGYEGVMITVAGSGLALALLILVVAPFSWRLLPVARQVFSPHYHWILWSVIAFMILSEWPKNYFPGEKGLGGLANAWSTLAAGLFTFFMSGLLGFVLLWKTPVHLESTFQNLMPAFVGLFTIPWLLLNIVSRIRMPPQMQTPVRVRWEELLKGGFAGGLGGGFAAFFPVITGGVGGLLAGHACALKDNKSFMVSQGASRMMYYVGGLFLFFVPSLGGMTRGGGSWLVKGVFEPDTDYEFYMFLAAIAFAGCVSILLMKPLTWAVISVIERRGYRRISLAALVFMVVIVVEMTGIEGLGVMLVAGAIGTIPVLFGSRRMNCLGVILLPMACSMSGVGTTVAGWLGLV